ncbi:hypothetical protein [Rodentibacter trehalosifermentans]|uniref:Uncharacterized protein n=1 Tax=Rodentibacter trehalosifermentans TaxID=1908263 RepID=A0A1V3IUQ6_9PAST|nr:hypothetical protein [Rodentibacter trehalosifermentans]OOF45985.1 hypothetical protein BKK51_04485 [Rodentibacter trehalosifermentans]OOF48619.1 hypothetical protein BKK53_09430 [Rodentibacter trehalosifermentans]
MRDFIEKIVKGRMRKAELATRKRGMAEFIIFQIIAKKLNKKSKQAIICSNFSKFYYFDKRRKGKKFLKKLNGLNLKQELIYCELNNDNSFNAKIFIKVNPRQPSIGQVFFDEFHGVKYGNE